MRSLVRCTLVGDVNGDACDSWIFFRSSLKKVGDAVPDAALFDVQEKQEKKDELRRYYRFKLPCLLIIKLVLAERYLGRLLI